MNWRGFNEGYEALCRAWDQGERDIDIVGFSRGAATALDFCHCIQERGVPRPGTGRDHRRLTDGCDFIGLWDVVAWFGLANLGNTALNIGHHSVAAEVGTCSTASHALALDERRGRPSCRFGSDGGCEVWFRGVHSDVGGGNKNRGLDDLTLRWMMHKGKAAGLPILQEDINALQPDPGGCAVSAGGRKLPLAIRTVSSDRSRPLHGGAAERVGEPA